MGPPLPFAAAPEALDRPARHRPSAFPGSRPLAGPHGRALARPAPGADELAQRLAPAPTLDRRRRLGERVINARGAMAAAAGWEVHLLDSTAPSSVPTRRRLERDGARASRRSAAPAAASRPSSTPAPMP